MPPEYRLPELSANELDDETILTFDDIMNEPEFTRNSTLDRDHLREPRSIPTSMPDHDQRLDKDDLVEPSVEEDMETIALRIPSDVDEAATSSEHEKNITYSYSQVKKEALELYHDDQPDFCVKNAKKETTRDVRDNASDEIVEMNFRWWDGGATYGY